MGDVADPVSRIGRIFLASVAAKLSPADTAIAQTRELGLDPNQVTDIVLTHLDADHAGGISDFPFARIHVSENELDAAFARSGVLGRIRYRPGQWEHEPIWRTHSVSDEDWYGFSSATVTDGVSLVALPGHTVGHCGVAVRRPGGGWLLHAGDSYYWRAEMNTPPSCPPGLAALERFMEVDHRARIGCQDALRNLREAHASTGEVRIFSAHDSSEYDELSSGATSGK